MDESRVEWREWGPEAFAVAGRTGRPVLVWLTTTWCVECREMARETFGDPRIAANVQDGFVPVRVDADRHPRVRERYAMGGFPSTVFLTPDGEVVTGATFLASDEFRDVLDRVRETYDASGASAGSVPRALRTEPPGGEVTAAVVRHVVGQLEAQWDEPNDGWGEAAKFPLPETIRFALRHDRDRAVRALAAVDRALRAPDGGFYRYAREPDWSDPARERTLAANAALLRTFADGYLTTGDDRFRGTAAATVRFLREHLGETRGFAGSLGPEGERDATRYAGPNAAAADALLAYTAYTDDRAAREAAEATLDYCREHLITDGRVVHYREESDVGEADLLTAVAWTVRAFTTARQVVGEGTETARAVADRAIDTLGDAHGAFRDGPREGTGLVDRPLYPVDATARLADALVDLAVLTGEDRYRERAKRGLAAFGDATDRMGVQVAGYARACERVLRDPLVVAVGAPARSDLHRAALRLADHTKVVVPDAPDVPSDAATIRGVDAEPARDPAALERLVASHAG